MSPKKILAVDDERHIVRLVEFNLQRAGYRVVTAFDGREALQKVKSEKPDLVVLDVMMPFVDGLEVLRRIRLKAATEDLPVIVLTAKALDKDVFEGWGAGANCYLTKPFDPKELLIFVKRLLDSRERGEVLEGELVHRSLLPQII